MHLERQQKRMVGIQRSKSIDSMVYLYLKSVTAYGRK